MRRTACWLVVAAVAIGFILWIVVRIASYVPADEVTAGRIVDGMSGSEVEQLFGRPPFQDSDITLDDLPDIRSFLHGDTTTREWDGPEGLITVVFDKEDRVQTVTCHPADNPVAFGPWIRTRLGFWP